MIIEDFCDTYMRRKMTHTYYALDSYVSRGLTHTYYFADTYVSF